MRLEPSLLKRHTKTWQNYPKPFLDVTILQTQYFDRFHIRWIRSICINLPLKHTHLLYLAKCSLRFDECKAAEGLYGIQDQEVPKAGTACSLYLEATSPAHTWQQTWDRISCPKWPCWRHPSTLKLRSKFRLDVNTFLLCISRHEPSPSTLSSSWFGKTDMLLPLIW